MGDFADDYGGYDFYDRMELDEQRDKERRAQRAKLLTPPRTALDFNIKVLVQRAVKEEREACANVCDAWQEWGADGALLAKAIRAKGDT